MKRTPHLHFLPRRDQQGSAVIIMLTFLVLMGLLAVAISRSNWQLRQELNLIEKKQIARLAADTNAPPSSRVLIAP